MEESNERASTLSRRSGRHDRKGPEVTGSPGHAGLDLRLCPPLIECTVENHFRGQKAGCGPGVLGSFSLSFSRRLLRITWEVLGLVQTSSPGWKDGWHCRQCSKEGGLYTASVGGKLPVAL